MHHSRSTCASFHGNKMADLKDMRTQVFYSLATQSRPEEGGEVLMVVRHLGEALIQFPLCIFESEIGMGQGMAKKLTFRNTCMGTHKHTNTQKHAHMHARTHTHTPVEVDVTMSQF